MLLKGALSKEWTTKLETAFGINGERVRRICKEVDLLSFSMELEPPKSKEVQFIVSPTKSEVLLTPNAKKQESKAQPLHGEQMTIPNKIQVLK